ncbi:AAA family ATPase [Vitreimonas sp.]|uniref:AAA family ATPase n=1 Tax=Vitreimonas sp. TaxID=3069702 RepID=UPI002EDABB92
MAESKNPSSPAKSLAVVSGKGGSGKTLVAATLALTLAQEGKRTILVDADMGTGGLTYYLGFSVFDRTRQGLAEFLQSAANTQSDVPITVEFSKASKEQLERRAELEFVSLLAVGEHRLTEGKSLMTTPSMERVVRGLGKAFDAVIIDCRGGIDDDSLAVCRAVQDIVVVVETDAAAIQSSQHLVDVLSREGIAKKVAGFVLNKVMDDPTSLAHAGASFFRTNYLGAIPFDIQTTRDFIKGVLPKQTSLFSRHVSNIASKLFYEFSIPKPARDALLEPSEFGTLTLRNPDIIRGGYIVAFALIAGTVAYVSARLNYIIPARSDLTAIASITAIACLSLSESFKENVGAVVRLYLDSTSTLMSKLSGIFR